MTDYGRQCTTLVGTGHAGRRRTRGRAAGKEIPIEFHRVLVEVVAALSHDPENRLLAVCTALAEAQKRDAARLGKRRSPGLALVQRVVFRLAIMSAYMPKAASAFGPPLLVPAEDWPRFIRVAHRMTEIAVGGLMHRGNATVH